MKVLYVFLVFILTITSATAQESYSVNNETSTILIKGTSSVHDWESNAEEFTGSAIFTITEGDLQSIENLAFSVNAQSIKSGKRIMDNKTKDALDAKKNPQITFEFLSLEEIKNDTVKVNGNLTMAGVTKEIMLTGAFQIEDDGSILVSGNQPIDMENYSIQPPTAMMGALKTGKDVDVEYRINFLKN
ncbi:MAG: YceI family protein [Balneolaceae bacterium]|nr:YceI family protein [Balneolaceae bacterium]MBO6547273.1 YceI family protein [Balneolaceae bacterium]MBO6647780.1 YceI family protein [Balneolaceae bacterium]